MSEFDLSQYELADTFVYTLKNARGDDDLTGTDGKPVTVEIYSPGSPQGVKALHKAARQAQMRLTRTLRGETNKEDAERADQEHAEKLAAFTKAFSSNFPVPALNVYANPRLVYISRQVSEQIDKLGNFCKGSSAS